jgi:3-deoxy-7-phosphoheptulonate synthase
MAKDAGATILRGGAYKPRTSPYAFQGLGEPGLDILHGVSRDLGLPFVTEVVTPADVDTVAAKADMLQVGARNMQNFNLLSEVGRAGRPVMLKRGMSATIEELLMAAEYVANGGCDDLVLCERGIRTFERFTRNTLDVSAVALAKLETHLPVLVDVTHSGGRRDLLVPLTKAALAVGAGGAEAPPLVAAWRQKFAQLVGEETPDGIEDAPSQWPGIILALVGVAFVAAHAFTVPGFVGPW